MSLMCNLCNASFNEKYNLNKHINKKSLCIDKQSLYKLIEEKNKLIESLRVSNNEVVNMLNIGDHNMNINVKIEINPITKLQIGYMSTDQMKELIEKYDDPAIPKNPEKLNLLLSHYIKNVMCDNEHPENQAVKYVRKKPPTYNTIIEDADGNIVNVIKGLKDTCELLSDPILDKLKMKLIEFVKKYKADTEPDFDYSLYEDAIKQLKKEFNKKTVKKALSSVLQNDILNNIQMKFDITKT